MVTDQKKRLPLPTWCFVALGVPIFYVFMIRRYLSLEGRVTKRDEIDLERFLQRHALSRDRFSPDQLNLLRSHCRSCRQGRWGSLVMVPLAGLVLYAAIVFLPSTSLQIFSDLTPTRTVIVNTVAQTEEEVSPDLEMRRQYTQMVMMSGALAGAMGFLSVQVLVLAIVQVWGTRERKTLIEFVKATGADVPVKPFEGTSPSSPQPGLR